MKKGLRGGGGVLLQTNLKLISGDTATLGGDGSQVG